jgi:hypothetical protein
MDACRLDAQLALSLDALLSLASGAGAAGRPELALAAAAAFDALSAYAGGDDDGEAPSDRFPDHDFPGAHPHVQH